MIDFSFPAELEDLRARVAAFVDGTVLPAEKQLGERPYWELVAELQPQARAAGLWCPFIPTEHGGMGLGHLGNALVQLEVGRSFSGLGGWALNCMSPTDATMLTILDHGSADQHERFLRPLVDGRSRVCFSMTEKNVAGSNATGLETTARLEGDTWILNGEKWFSSGATTSDLAMIIAKSDPDAPRHRQYSAFLVELPATGYRILRDIPVLGDVGQPAVQDEIVHGHAEVRIEQLEVPAANLVGVRGDGFLVAQHRLGYGRLRHGMRSIAKAQAALDMAAKRCVERSMFGRRLGDLQGVQWQLADCARDLYIARLMVLHIAYKLENGDDIATENAIAKVFVADMLSSVIDRALQLHGSHGYSLDLPLARWYAEARGHHLIDGPDEVHRWKSGRRVIEAFERTGTTASVAGGDLF
ncbi:acyl-CoA dehydrogenase family protein [Kribbella solani]|uniref:acyl-CoA dehydrogenase family protein n=1 Tax=Kribbella solani TaxID=236067 RepID=UPI0029B3E7B6|nr:acyl-CoA dehydrogenase family protein [Kribbella solani]MDX2968149.1 acyl-CoA dehydrogenase family protein [Kribbella solani]MDX3004838.1 acyl-CoA dehydrogenase family protein [Kribbella solani]